MATNCTGGYLTVEPAPPFLLGSELTVYCHTTQATCHSRLALELNHQLLQHEERVSCSMAKIKLANIHRPKSILLCNLMTDGHLKVVCGLDLTGGLPPDKPTDISCETSWHSDVIDCTWNRGQETYLLTTFNISVTRENGSQVHYNSTRSTGEFTMPKTGLDDSEKYLLTVTASNHFGMSESEPFILRTKDIVIPETPYIVQIDFYNNSVGTTLHWKSPESSQHLRSYVRLKTENGSWAAGQGTELSEGLVSLEGLQLLTQYEFQIRVCRLTKTERPAATPSSTFSNKPVSRESPLCSKWSPSYRRKSPGKGPSQQLTIWRLLGDKEANGLQDVTVFWKPLSPDDFSGEVQWYEIILDPGLNQKVRCPAAVSQCSVQVSPRVQALSVSAVTSYGKSPPATIMFRYSGASGPALRRLAPAGDDSVVLSWSRPKTEQSAGSAGELLGYVLEWTSKPTELHWQTVSKGQTTTSITGLTAGVRYNVSLYAVTTRGVSSPSSGLVYSKEEEPLSGPNVSILVHEATRVLIEWEELAVDQQRGFITSYTIHLRSSASGHTKQHSKATVTDSGPRQMWLNCPEGTLSLFMSASNSAGEGPPGISVSSLPADPAVDVVSGLIITALVMMVMAKLVCWSCVKKRIKQNCVSLGPACLADKLPKLENSYAIKQLKEGSICNSYWSFIHSDPLLSPIDEITEVEREGLYPIIQTDGFNNEPGQFPMNEAPQTTDTGTMPTERLLELHVSYMPQIAASAPQQKEENEAKRREEKKNYIAACELGHKSSSASGGLWRSCFSTVEMDLSSSSLGTTQSPLNDLLGTDAPGLESLLCTEDFLRENRTTSDVEKDTASLDLQQDEKSTSDETASCQLQFEATLTSSYFPQLAMHNVCQN
ncbi:interleukin-23 receptor [Lampris incognitus]|uniref:interleukin-23 receptor n=1 Tax=Lampris incognitus TaxID=2546036 RepID=UPI0024B5E71B|nr:interleukin-23 receptor [Lampris incognitus]